jgi:hypothetical protein
MVPIKNLKHRSVQPPNVFASSEKKFRQKFKPEGICNKPYRRAASGSLETPSTNINKTKIST